MSKRDAAKRAARREGRVWVVALICAAIYLLIF